MGLFKKIKKVAGDVVDGVMKGVDKVLGSVGINLSKVLDNDWVKGGLLAASIFTGGVAIANGVMSGYASATAAQAAQTTVAGAAKSTFMDTFVAGAKGFMSGVSQGMANPLDTAGSLVDSAQTAMGFGDAAATGIANTGVGGTGDMVTQGMVDPGGAQAMNAGGAPPGMHTEASGAMPNAIEPNRPDFMALNENGVADATMANAPAAAPSDYGFSDMADNGSFGLPGGSGDALSGQLAQGEQGWLESLASGAKDFVSSPTGMMTAANAVQGWAQGSMIEKRWDEMQKVDKQRRKSWTDFDAKANTPSYDIPSLKDLRARTAKMRERGNQAQAKYGYS